MRKQHEIFLYCRGGSYLNSTYRVKEKTYKEIASILLKSIRHNKLYEDCYISLYSSIARKSRKYILSFYFVLDEFDFIQQIKKIIERGVINEWNNTFNSRTEI